MGGELEPRKYGILLPAARRLSVAFIMARRRQEGRSVRCGRGDRQLMPRPMVHKAFTTTVTGKRLEGTSYVARTQPGDRYRSNLHHDEEGV